MNREISEKIKLFGFLMTCVIVFYHSPSVDTSFVRGNLDMSAGSLLEYCFGTMGTIAMSYFFTVTGFLLFQNYTFPDYPVKMKRRIFSLLVPYVLWQCITVALKLVTGDAVSPGDFIQKTFLFARFPYNGALWYVYAVFFLALLSPVLLLLFQNKAVGWCAVLAFTVFSAAKDRITVPVITDVINYGYFGNVLRYIPSYLTGCFYGKFAAEEEGAKVLKYVFSALFMALLLEERIPGFFLDLSVKLMPIIALYVLPSLPGVAGKRIFGLTFLVYAIHQPLIGILWSILNRVYALMPLPATVCNLLTRAVVLAAALCAAAVIHGVLKRLSPRLLRALTGGRT